MAMLGEIFFSGEDENSWKILFHNTLGNGSANGGE